MPSSAPSSSRASRTRASHSSTRQRSTMRRTASTLSKCAAGAALCCLGVTAVQAAQFEPPGDQILLGMWFDPADPYYDTPSLINTNLGYNVPVFQLAQEIPLPPYNYTTGAGGAAPENMIERSGTDAAVFLTVYPASGFDTVTDDDFTALGKQILDYQVNLNRTVFLRYAPEMQGLWMEYGQQPTAFNQSWHQMYNLVKATAPETIMVWAPNTPQGYPYGQTTQFQSASAADQALLDTNNNGELDADDDSLAPYYPGDDVVDWIGLSIYYKGIPSDTQNTVQPDGYCANVINGVNPADGAAITPWYTTYCQDKPDKACMFAEAAAAYHTDDDGTASQYELQRAWVRDCVTNMTLYDNHPRLKMYMHFEHNKTESANDGSQDNRDFRMLNNTEARAEIIADLASAGTRFSWANSRAPPTSISSAGAPAATNSDGQSIIQAITATTRAKPTTFPSLFGLTSDGTQRAEWAELGIMVAAGMVGAWTVMRTL
ncbi:hypothetical protein JCM10207_005663 [Rhodosporidiobolus poonsookiae]